jgi:hypothetical protein
MSRCLVVFCPQHTQPEKLTPAQQAARRSNKTGAITDLFRMVISLTKRW